MKSFVSHVVACVAAVAGTLAAFADATPDWRHTDYSTWVQLIESDDGTGGNVTANWSWSGSRFWSDTKSPHSDASYYVPVNMLHMMDGRNYAAEVRTFGGARLAIAGTMKATSHSVCKCMDYREAIFLPGSTYEHFGDTVTGKVTVVTTAEKPLTFTYSEETTSAGTWRPTLQFPADVSSDCSDSVIVLDRTATSRRAIRTFAGDWSGFTGRIVNRSDETKMELQLANSFAGCPGTYAIAGGLTNDLSTTVYHATFAGTLAADAGGVLTVSAATTLARPVEVTDGGALQVAAGASLSVPSLACSDGATLVLPYAENAAAPITVTTSVSFGTVTLAFTGFTVNAITNGVKTIPLVRLSGAAASVTPTLSGITLPKAIGALPKAFLELADAGDGSGDKLIVYRWTRPIVTNTAKGYDPGTGVSWVTTPEEYWSDQQNLHGDVDYLVIASGTLLQSGHSIDFGDYPVTFAGGATVPYNYVVGNDVCYDGSLNAGGIVWGCYGSVKKTFGPKTTVCGLWIVKGYGNNTATFTGTLHGTGTVYLTVYNNNNTKSPIFWGNFNADATDFGGRILLKTPRCGAHSQGRPPMPDYDKSYIARAYVTEAKNLGGVYGGGGDGSDALTLGNDAELVVNGDIDYCEPTRGVFVVNRGNFKVKESKTFKIRNRVTYAGEFVKRGAGTLVLGGTALFSDGTTAVEPTAETCTNKLTILEGVFEPIAATATDGLEISFSSGTSMLLDGTCAGGLRSVRDGSSVTIADAKLPIAYASGVAPAEATETKSVDLATFATEESAAAFAAKADVPRRLANVGLLEGSPTAVENDDATWTVRATYRQLGLLLLVR